MKKSILYIAVAALMLPAISACDEEFELPPMILPEATWEANTTIKELKETYWQDSRNFATKIGADNLTGKHKIIKGIVSSSDYTGNVYKNILLQQTDADGKTYGLTVAINGYDLYQSYQYGQEVYIDVTGLYIGNYNGLLQLGWEGTYNNAPSMTFMAADTMTVHSQCNGLGAPERVDTALVTIPQLKAALNSKAGIIEWQSRLIRINNVQWDEAGLPFAGASTVSRNISDAEGNKLEVRNSSYADFKDEIMPYGSGDIVGVLTTYGTSWQLTLIDAQGCINFTQVATPRFSRNSGIVAEGTEITISCATEDATIHYTLDGSEPNENSTTYSQPIVISSDVTIKACATKEGMNMSGVAEATYTVGEEAAPVPTGDGSAAAPFNASQALSQAIANGNASSENVYVAGYIVSGEISSTYGSGTWMIADTPSGDGVFTLYGIYDFGNKKFTDYNKVKLGDLVVCLGPIYNYNGKTPEMSKGQLYSLNGSTSGDTPGGSTPGGDTPASGAGSLDSPFTVADVIGGSASGSSVWVEGYIVGWVDGQVLSSGAQFNSTSTSATNLLLAASASETNVNACIPVQLPAGEVRNALNLKDNPGNYKKAVKLCGSIEKYFGTTGVKTVTAYEIDGQQGGTTGGDDTPSTGTPAGDGTAASPYNVTKAIEVAKANGQSSSTNVYTYGYVKSGSIDTGYGNATFVVTDNPDGSGSSMTFFRFKDFGNAAFTDANKIKAGDKIVVYAPLVNYMGNTPETSYGNLYSINGKTE